MRVWEKGDANFPMIAKPLSYYGHNGMWKAFERIEQSEENTDLYTVTLDDGRVGSIRMGVMLPTAWVKLDQEKPDWGHGPNTPVRQWREDQIRAVMDEHRPAQEGDCLCAWAVHSPNPQQEFTTDHLIEELKRL